VKIRLDYDKWTDIADTFEFTQKLMDEENVLCLPGECFLKSGFIRLGTAAQHEHEFDDSHIRSVRYIDRSM
jgi:aspartate/methionine/tyrosine aminotransferase